MTAGLVVTSDADLVKRAVGPTAWLVFEHLALTADDDLESSATARSVGIAVSVSKDTAAAAIRRLEAVGLVARRPQARRHGRFGAASLRVALAGRGDARLHRPDVDPDADDPATAQADKRTERPGTRRAAVAHPGRRARRSRLTLP